MKNLSKEVLINELDLKTELLVYVNERIYNEKITNQAHKLYQWKDEILGAINMLQLLINKLN